MMNPHIIWLALICSSLASAEERVPWTTSKIKGSPDPAPPYIAERLWPHIQFDRALEITRLDSENRIFIIQQTGEIFSLPSSPSARPEAAELHGKLKDHVDKFVRLLGICFHPNFKDNREVFLFYNIKIGPNNNDQSTAIARYHLDDQLQLDASRAEIIIEAGGGGHNGGHMKFGPDGMFYFTLGDFDAPSPPDHRNWGQDTSNLASTIVRIDVDNRDPRLAYKIPKDNPFVDLEGTRPEIWAFGFRNPWKICFNPANGDLWTGDVGWELWEMLYKVEKGGNYGWSIMEGPQPTKTDQPVGPAPISPPTYFYSHMVGASVTGGYFWQSSRLPDLVGSYLYGDFVTGRLWGLQYEGDSVKENTLLADTRKQIVTFGEMDGGEVVFLDWQFEQNLYRLVPNPNHGRPVTNFPQRLSKTGLFQNTKKQKPVGGVYEFKINTPSWNDGATSRYWVGVPGEGTIETFVRRRQDSPLLQYEKPDDTVLARTISLGERKVETQILHYDGYWKGYTYQWNEDQTDAELVPKAGLETEIDGKPWRFPSRSECVRCHGSNFHRPLAFLPGQINRDGQIERFLALGLVDKKFKDSTKFQPLVDPHDSSKSLDARARSWLHINCAQCHRVSGGGGVTARMDIASPLDTADLLNVAPSRGGFGLDDPQLIAPGDPYNSVLYYRIATRGSGHMPMLGPKSLDEEGIRLIHDWIRAMDPDKTTSQAKMNPKTASEALALQHRIQCGNVPETKRDDAIKACLTSENPYVQNLFYGVDETN
ncbi:MAG: PQQ-dependent sugar dehydrogenase [Verrucomicrobiota bacterium]